MCHSSDSASSSQADSASSPQVGSGHQISPFGRLRTPNFAGGEFKELGFCPSAGSGHQISPEAKFGGGGGSRTRVRKHSTRASTYLS